MLIKNKKIIQELHAEFPDRAVPKRRKEYHVKRIPCCFLLKDSDDKTVLKLNETSVLIWELCNGDMDVGEMMEMLEEGFPDAREHMRKDLFRVLDQFQEEEVITITGA